MTDLCKQTVGGIMKFNAGGFLLPCVPQTRFSASFVFSPHSVHPQSLHVFLSRRVEVDLVPTDYTLVTDKNFKQEEDIISR
jgi:hypothetical protein